MSSFSERYGFRPVKSVIQVNSMDDALRNSLWNALDILLLSNNGNFDDLNVLETERGLSTALWLHYFKTPFDQMPDTWSGVKNVIRSYFFKSSWFEVYDFIEFVASHVLYEPRAKSFRASCNNLLERELSGYRFVGEQIAPITSKDEISDIEEALYKSGAESVNIHLKTALEHFSNKESPDYRNSIKESISAVEAFSSQIAGKDKAELAEALKTLKDKIKLHTALEKGFIKLYGYTSDADGIRHALLEEPNLDFEDAKFMLVACSAFINYLKVKASKAGVIK